ncbi:tyrosine-type recombinase/integrase [Nonomuraea sp. NPDC052129]|uniref:tyrosine-type recombinase/integrase n=1 Tax=Nonomuraea sp. NPDC052129 TaxID=3154651 RepID=UPI00342219C3
MTARKPRTRGNREARPYQRKSDGKWCVPIYLPTGRRKVIYGDSRTEVVEKKRQAEAEIEAGQPITAGRTDLLSHYLLKVWLTTTLPQRVEAGRLAESTFDSYRDTVVKHVVPHLGHVRLVDLSTTHIREWLRELAKKPSGRQRQKLRPGETELPPPAKLSARTIAICYATLRKALNDAVKDESVKRNVCLLVDAPANTVKEMEALTKEEATRLLAEAAGDRLWAYWLVVLALGLRRGEGLGMRWSLTDLDVGTTRLEKTIQRLRGDLDEETGKRKGRLVEKSLKTAASQATLALPQVVIEALAEHHKVQEDERKAAPVWLDPDLVFCTGLGTPLEPRNVNREWYALVGRAEIGRKVRIHDLRHAAATFLFSQGTDTKKVQGALRHASHGTTANLYIHLLEEVRRETADTMNEVLTDLGAYREKRRRAS